MTTVAADPYGVTLDEAWHAWLEEKHAGEKKARTRRQYALTLRRVSAFLGAGDRAVTTVTGQDYFRALTGLWGSSKANTWNTNRATVMGFLTWMRKYRGIKVELPAQCEQRTVYEDETKALDVEVLERLWQPGAAKLRERTLWRLAYESSSRADALLSLDVEQIEWGEQRAAVVQKGGSTVYLHFGDEGMALLRELVGDRTTGPVFLTDTRPWNWRDRPRKDRGPGDRCRLSYNRAEEMFKEATRQLDLADEGLTFEFLTLHRVRHSRLTHLAEEGVDTPVLQALSGHRDPRTLLRRYARVRSRALRRILGEVERKVQQRRDAYRRPPCTGPRPDQGRAARWRMRH